MSKNDEVGIEFEEGSGNVFADLGLEDADGLYARSQLGFHVYRILTDMNLKQREIAALLGIKQPEVSHRRSGAAALLGSDLYVLLRRQNRDRPESSPSRPRAEAPSAGTSTNPRNRCAGPSIHPCRRSAKAAAWLSRGA